MRLRAVALALLALATPALAAPLASRAAAPLHPRDVVGRVGYKMVGRAYLQVPPYGAMRRLAPKGPAPRLADLDVKIGSLLGTGAEKEAYTLANDPDHVLVVSKNADADAVNKVLAEREMLKEGAALGYPVASIEVGLYKGRPAFIQERFAIHSNDAGFRDRAQLSKFATAQTLADLDRIYTLSRKTHTGFVDFQYGLTKDGRVLINDPRNFVKGPLVGPLMRFTVARDREHVREALH